MLSVILFLDSDEVSTDKVSSCVQLIPNGSRKECKEKAREIGMRRLKG